MTMVQVASLFNQLLQHFPRAEFAALVKKHGAEHAAKGFTCWTQFVSMLFCQLGRADSLREICNGLACCLGRLVHLGINKAPCRSTLSYANEHRPAALFEELFWTASARFRQPTGAGRQEAQIPLQQQTPVVGFDHYLAVLDPVSVGQIPSRQGWGQSPRAAGPRRLPASLRPTHRGQA